jgi:hypothetical protein
VFSDDVFKVDEEEVLTKWPHTERPEGTRTSGRVIQPRRSTDVLIIKKSTGSKKRPPKPDEPEMILEGNFGDMHAELWKEFCLCDPYRFKKRAYTGETSYFGLRDKSRCGMTTTMRGKLQEGLGCASTHTPHDSLQ